MVKLPLEEDEVFASLRLSVHKSVLEFFKGVNDFEEVLLLQEECIIFSFSLFYFQRIINGGIILTDKGFDWDQKSILVEILLEGRSLIVLESILDLV